MKEAVANWQDPDLLDEYDFIVDLRINETLQTGAVENRTYRGAKVSLYFLNSL